MQGLGVRIDPRLITLDRLLCAPSLCWSVGPG